MITFLANIGLAAIGIAVLVSPFIFIAKWRENIKADNAAVEKQRKHMLS